MVCSRDCGNAWGEGGFDVQKAEVICTVTQNYFTTNYHFTHPDLIQIIAKCGFYTEVDYQGNSKLTVF